MATGYLLYHGIRLARQALGIARESRREGPSPAEQAASTGAFVQLIAEKEEFAREYGEHSFVRGPITRGPQGQIRELCVTCGRMNDGIVHRPTWGRG